MARRKPDTKRKPRQTKPRAPRIAEVVEPTTDEAAANEAALAEAMQAIDDANKAGNALGEAIAAHFGTTPDKLAGFVVSAEYQTDEGTSLSSAWSLASTPWALRSYAAELTKHVAAL